MTLAGSWRTQQVHALSPFNKLQLRQRQDPLTIQTGLERKVIAGQRLDGGQAGRLQRHLDAARIAGVKLFAQQLLDQFQTGQTALF